ncbi:MAG: FHA domain-containing protein [Myxococcales bacterium]|nr:FHA domain-containing protein [Myxococcales bacterium]
MWSWFAKVFGRGAAGAKAESEGRVDDAVRIYVDAGDRAEACRVLLRAAETARTLSERRSFYTRAYALARTEDQRESARKGLALATLAEFSSSPPRSDEDRVRLVDAARDLEQVFAYKDAARAYELLEDREAIVRVLTLSGDVDALERITGEREDSDRHRLRRRGALERFDTLWRSGDRLRAVEDLRGWLLGHGDDHEARQCLDEHLAKLLRAGRFEARLDGAAVTVIGRFPVVLGREADVVFRGASVSRRHAEIVLQDQTLALRDAGSRSGTTVDGLAITEAIPLVPGHLVQLGADLVLRCEGDLARGLSLVVERGLDRGRTLVLAPSGWATGAGALAFRDEGPALAPTSPVVLNGTRVAVPFVLALGDRVEWGASQLEITGR